MLSLINFNRFNRKQTSKYRALTNDDKILLEAETDSLQKQPMELKNDNFDIMRLPNRIGSESKVKRRPWRYFRRSWKLRFSRHPKRKAHETAITHLKLILKNQPQPVYLSEEGDLKIKKLPPKVVSKKAAANVMTQLKKNSDAKVIISMLKREPHPSYGLTETDLPDCPLRGVCLLQSQADFDSQMVSGEDMIDVTKSLAMRIAPSSEIINLITGLSFGKLVGIVSESTGLFDVLAIGSKNLIDRTDAHQDLIGMVPKDRVSVWSCEENFLASFSFRVKIDKLMDTDKLDWWGYEIALPPPSFERLKQAKSIETTAFQILAALTATTGAIEIFPLIKYLSSYLDIEWNAITAENKGQGVVIAATWALPMALVPRAWDFDTPAIPQS